MCHTSHGKIDLAVLVHVQIQLAPRQRVSGQSWKQLKEAILLVSRVE